jgi:hypothetical protein
VANPRQVIPAAETIPAFKNSRRLVSRIFSSVDTGKTLVFAGLSLRLAHHFMTILDFRFWISISGLPILDFRF